jgi:hypothetical protein
MRSTLPMYLFRFAAAAVALALLSGCGPAGPRKVRVSGTVTLDGKPLNHGEIYFMVPGGGTPPDILPVADGKFEGSVTVGKKRVEVYSLKDTGKSAGMPTGLNLIINCVHDDYSVNSKLTAEVTDGGLSPSAFAVKASGGARY